MSNAEFVFRQVGGKHHAFPVEGVQIALCGVYRNYDVLISIGEHCKRCEASLRRIARERRAATA